MTNHSQIHSYSYHCKQLHFFWYGNRPSLFLLIYLLLSEIIVAFEVVSWPCLNWIFYQPAHLCIFLMANNATSTKDEIDQIDIPLSRLLKNNFFSTIAAFLSEIAAKLGFHKTHRLLLTVGVWFPSHSFYALAAFTSTTGAHLCVWFVKDSRFANTGHYPKILELGVFPSLGTFLWCSTDGIFHSFLIQLEALWANVVSEFHWRAVFLWYIVHPFNYYSYPSRNINTRVLIYTLMVFFTSCILRLL